MIFRGKPKSELSDSEIIKKFQASGNQQFLGELFLRYSHLVYGVCFKYLNNTEESKDAVMEIFDRLNTLLINHNIKNFKPWLHSVTKNYCLMKLRKDAKGQLVPLPEDEENQIDFMELPDFLHLLDRQEEENSYKILSDEIEKLNESQKTCIKLFFIENKSYSEINNITGYDFKQVKSFIQNGKRNLKLKLQKLKEAI